MGSFARWKSSDDSLHHHVNTLTLLNCTLKNQDTKVYVDLSTIKTTVWFENQVHRVHLLNARLYNLYDSGHKDPGCTTCCGAHKSEREHTSPLSAIGRHPVNEELQGSSAAVLQPVRASKVQQDRPELSSRWGALVSPSLLLDLALKQFKYLVLERQNGL